MLEMENRRSIRKYKNQAVEKEKLDRLIRSAMLAPSGNNTQPWHFIIIDDPRIKKEVARVSHNQKWMETAPVLIACVADIRSRITGSGEMDLGENTELFELKQIIRDTAISVEHIVLEAVHQNLGTCWVSWFTQEDIRPVLNIPADKYVVTVLTMGYPDENPPKRPRKKIEETVHRNSW